MIGIDGIAVINIVSNPSDAEVSGKKKLQTRISHNDGATWKPLTPPDRDSLDEEYDCRSTVSQAINVAGIRFKLILQSCALQIHGYTERRDPKATYSSPSAVGVSC